MNNTTKTILGLIVALVAVWGIYTLTQKSNEPTVNEPIKIGVSAPLSGNIAFLGEGVRDAILMAQSELKDAKYNYEIIFEDDQFNPTNAATVANKLLSIDKVDVIVSMSSGIGNVVSPIAEKNNVVHMCIGASDSNVAEGKYNFIHWTPPSEEVKVFVEELQKRGITKLGVFGLNDQWTIAVMNELKNKIGGTNIEVVTNQAFNFGEKDFKTVIAKAKSSNAELYLIIAYSPELEILTKQIKELGITTPLTALESFDLTEQMDLFEGNWFVSAASPTQNFVDKFNEKFGKNPSFGSANGYDVFNLIVQATENVQTLAKPTSEMISDELLKIKDFDGALGKLNVLESGIIWSNAVVKIIKDGKSVLLNE